MGDRPERIVCIMFALCGLGCVANRDLERFDQPGRVASWDEPSRGGSLPLAPDVSIRAQSGDAPPAPAAGAGEAPDGPIGPGWVARAVVFARAGTGFRGHSGESVRLGGPVFADRDGRRFDPRPNRAGKPCARCGARRHRSPGRRCGSPARCSRKRSAGQRGQRQPGGHEHRGWHRPAG